MQLKKRVQRVQNLPKCCCRATFRRKPCTHRSHCPPPPARGVHIHWGTGSDGHQASVHTHPRWCVHSAFNWSEKQWIWWLPCDAGSNVPIILKLFFSQTKSMLFNIPLKPLQFILLLQQLKIYAMVGIECVQASVFLTTCGFYSGETCHTPLWGINLTMTLAKTLQNASFSKTPVFFSCPCNKGQGMFCFLAMLVALHFTPITHWVSLCVVVSN